MTIKSRSFVQDDKKSVVILSNAKDLFLILVKPTPDSSLTLRMTGTQIQVLYFVEDNKTVCHP